MDDKTLKILSKSAAATGIIILLSNYYVDIPKKHNDKIDNLHNYFYKQIEPDFVFEKWQGSYRFEKASTLPERKNETFIVPAVMVSDTAGTMVVHIEPISIEIFASQNSLLGYKTNFDLPRDERLN
ncbi:MAG: hypothetical protein A2528_00770 [Candidatus Staskawiczbacteria bacterium RIFOXYD2_FULL_37_9]|uniref:Uncharacterized protein n=1 Tax=Candidatus Staskawiczbacteria bacterium RIFOXYB1_FULL_37_44 TaxID=1802223 RepID=A0A1G2IWL0_9BACT|nr:MAG: hypothetical protein A2358_00650 [Candidatus Staskawiczbacteria bacterium RIFOXYB1_FULL_37_44]OGZ83938.1 MAG: hypothetical protein A2416_01545 [Candidatus Staskawiczbacteria bacterium RIFOXYC1_FULL_37_52]OGZ88980.1 MAG: hypothetical protein A2444_00590 [Candidatus Staskawiczbacteria bacterium RIFOXYC2_FULL_37_19]OGZ92706.1 MAG: hypothetical protein A2528_00770 [Candidatus Staskawiczbacteria bacterium RIFOXYD2_FULL_37_9]